MSSGVGLDKQDMDLKVFWRDKLQQSHPMLRAESEGRIQSLLGKSVDVGTPRQDFTFAE